MNGLLLAAASAASAASKASAARAGHPPFSLSNTLPWTIPVLLLAPLIGLVTLLLGVRTRRATISLSILTAFVTLVDAVIVAAARFGFTAVKRATYSWINVSIAYTGNTRFQQFEIDIALRITHAVLFLLIGLLICFLICLASQRPLGRNEPGPIRSQAIALLLLLATVGVLVSGDLAELLAFWLVAGIASYLLIGNRWGGDAAARSGQIALALPFLGDIALLCGVALLWSRYGITDIDKLVPMFGRTAGVGLKSTDAIAALLLVAIVARSALFPLTLAQTAMTDGPPAFTALVASVWPLLCGYLLFLCLPLFGHVGPQLPRAAGWTLGVAAVAGPALAILILDIRRSMLLATSGVVALCLLAILYPGAAAAGLTGLVAVSAGRAGMLLASGWIVSRMRAVDPRLLGEGLRRMRGATIGLGASGVGVALAAVAASGWRHPSLPWIAVAVALLLAVAVFCRSWGAVGLGAVPRRRAFEPGRIRDASQSLVTLVLLCAVVAVIAAVLAFIPIWTEWLAPGRPAPPAPLDQVRWLVPPVLGGAIGLVLLALRRRQALVLSARVSALYGRAIALVTALIQRIWSGAMALVGEVELRALPNAEGELAGAIRASGAGLATLPLLGAIAVIAVVVGVVLGVLGLGAGR